jgi:hypothetical protein
MLNPSDINGFKRLLAETAAWCTQRASLKDPKQSLRILRREAIDLSTLNRDQLRQVADDIFQQSRRWLPSGMETPSNENLAGGRLLIAYPEESVWDGAAEAASRGFFDVADHPAWDTWCYYGNDFRAEPGFFIVSWVPNNFIDLAQEGIDVNPVDSIQWASKFDNALTQALRSEGLI